MLKIKDNVNLKELERFGFKLGKYYADHKERFIQNKEDYDDYFKVLVDNNGRVEYSDKHFDQAAVLIHVQRHFSNRLWITATPVYSDMLDPCELNIVTDTLFDLMQSGLIEKEEE